MFVNGSWMALYDRAPYWKALSRRTTAAEIKESTLSNKWVDTPGAGLFAKRNFKAGDAAFIEDFNKSKLYLEKGVDHTGHAAEPQTAWDLVQKRMPKQWDAGVARNFTFVNTMQANLMSYWEDLSRKPPVETDQDKLAVARLIAVWKANCIMVGSCPAMGEPDREIELLSTRAAYINHSCSIPLL